MTNTEKTDKTSFFFSGRFKNRQDFYKQIVKRHGHQVHPTFREDVDFLVAGKGVPTKIQQVINTKVISTLNEQEFLAMFQSPEPQQKPEKKEFWSSLRELLLKSPSQKAFQDLLHFLSIAVFEETEAVFSYVREHLTSWPPTTRCIDIQQTPLIQKKSNLFALAKGLSLEPDRYGTSWPMKLIHKPENIRYLLLRGNRYVNKFPPLSNFKILEELHCSRLKVKNLKVLKSLPRLKKLSLERMDSVGSLKGIEDCRNLTALELIDIQSWHLFDRIQYPVPNIKSLSITNFIYFPGDLSHFSGLTALSVEASGHERVYQYHQLTLGSYLASLRLSSHNNLCGFDNRHYLKNLRTLYIERCDKLCNLDFLGRNEQLEEITIKQQRYPFELDALSSLPNIKRLTLHKSKFSSCASLLQLKELEEVIIEDCPSFQAELQHTHARGKDEIRQFMEKLQAWSRHCD